MSRSLFLLFPLLFVLCAATGSAALRRPVYKGAIVVDVATGRALFADRADEVSPPASMAKLMTFAVAEDRIRSGALSLATEVAITAEDARVARLRDSTNVDLRAGERFPLEELFYAMMIQSANDAAWAVARFVGGSVPQFVAEMNAKARSLGMTRTVFRTPNGLPVPSHRIADGDLTTPRDFALLCRYLLVHTDILKYTSVRSRYFGRGLRFPPRLMTNHNHLLGRIAGVDGLKTGFTNGAGFCLAATAERRGRRIVVVMMDCPDARSRDIRVSQLIERGFATLPPAIPAVGGGPAAPAAAPNGRGAASLPMIHFAVPQ